MLDTEDIRWVKTTANELNNLLQVISESSKVLESRSDGSPDSEKYFGILRNGLERAARMATESPYPNPRKIEYAAVLSLLQDAHAGRLPSG